MVLELNAQTEGYLITCSSPGGCWNNTLKYIITASFHIPSLTIHDNRPFSLDAT